MNYKDRLLQTNLLPLSVRRDEADLVYLFKCLNGDNNVNIDDFVQFASSSQRVTRQNSSPRFLIVPRVRTERHRRFYFNRVAYNWNKLPANARSMTNLSEFKSFLRGHLNERFQISFDPLNMCTWC